MTPADDNSGAGRPLDQLAQIIAARLHSTTLDDSTLEGDAFDSGGFDSGGFDGGDLKTGDFDDVAAPTHWPSLPSADTAVEWDELRAWVDALQRRFAHLDHHVIPRCWWAHNDHVEALSALRDHERSSYAPTAPATAPVDWFRALRDIAALLKSWTADLGCGPTHTTPPAPPRPVDENEWDKYVTADATRRAEAEIDRAAQ